MIVPDAFAADAVITAGVSPEQTVAVDDVIVPTVVITFSTMVIEATSVQLLNELTVTSITSPPLRVKA